MATWQRWVPRPQRVRFALAVVWVVAVLDFRFTVRQRHSHGFVELNPVAACILGTPALALATYKFGLLGTGTAILLALRHSRAAECGCWFLFATNAYLALQWYRYFDFVWQGSDGFPLGAPPFWMGPGT